MLSVVGKREREKKNGNYFVVSKWEQASEIWRVLVGDGGMFKRCRGKGSNENQNEKKNNTTINWL